MSVAVVANLSDGVIIGVDSAVTVSNANGIQKVFEDAEKLFRLADKIGVATYGVAGLEGRSIGSFVREFERDAKESWRSPDPGDRGRFASFFL